MDNVCCCWDPAEIAETVTENGGNNVVDADDDDDDDVDTSAVVVVGDIAVVDDDNFLFGQPIIDTVVVDDAVDDDADAIDSLFVSLRINMDPESSCMALLLLLVVDDDDVFVILVGDTDPALDNDDVTPFNWFEFVLATVLFWLSAIGMIRIKKMSKNNKKNPRKISDSQIQQQIGCFNVFPKQPNGTKNQAKQTYKRSYSIQMMMMMMMTKLTLGSQRNNSFSISISRFVTYTHTRVPFISIQMWFIFFLNCQNTT